MLSHRTLEEAADASVWDDKSPIIRMAGIQTGMVTDGTTAHGSTPMHQPIIQTVLATDKPSYENCESALITVTVVDGAGPVERVVVLVEVTAANGAKLAGDGMTGADGVASLRYEVDVERDGVGTYTVNTLASKPGFESASDSRTFEVTNQSRA